MEDTAQISDSKLVSAVIGGNADAFRPLILRHQRKVFGCVYAIVQNRDDAADIAQNTFIRFYRNIEQFDMERPLPPYLLAIAVNCARSFLREKLRTSQFNEELIRNEAALSGNGAGGPAEEMAGAELSEKVRSAVKKLPLTLREVCSLFYFSECSCAEIAAIMEMSEGAVKTALHRARKKMLEIYLSDNRGENAYGL